jgi:alkylation response protein AidB-like acyl-CoA dehydrogenase
MTSSLVTDFDSQATTNSEWAGVARELGPGFAARAAAHDAASSFVADNYRELKQHRVFSAAVPHELGGGGASHPEVCAMLREIARHCGSTALAVSMHTHLVAAAVWRYRQWQPTAALLERIAAEQLVLVSTGASDWLDPESSAHWRVWFAARLDLSLWTRRSRRTTSQE